MCNYILPSKLINTKHHRATYKKCLLNFSRVNREHALNGGDKPWVCVEFSYKSINMLAENKMAWEKSSKTPPSYLCIPLAFHIALISHNIFLEYFPSAARTVVAPIHWIGGWIFLLYANKSYGKNTQWEIFFNVFVFCGRCWLLCWKYLVLKLKWKIYFCTFFQFYFLRRCVLSI